MDFSLGAVKVVSQQLKEATKATSPPSSYTLGGGVLFQRAWLQGLLVSILLPDDSSSGAALPRFLIDDGTGVIELSFNNKDFFAHTTWEVGMYVMVVGSYVARADEIPLIKIHKIVDLSAFPDREAMWYLEVIEAYRMFYKPFLEE
ncbi:hypothetical protein vseg_018335 [Gypsophila vaccaria]